MLLMRISIQLWLCCAAATCFGSSMNETFCDYEKIFEEYKASVPYYSVENPRLMILFSGTPGMGKSTLSKKLERDLQGMRVSSDESRALLKKYGRNSMEVGAYLEWLLVKLQERSPNHLIILDKSMDRNYQAVMEFARKYGFKTYLIRMTMERSNAEERIRFRGENVEKLIQNADNHWGQYAQFGDVQQHDFLFDNSAEGMTDEKVAPLIQSIRNFSNHASR